MPHDLSDELHRQAKIDLKRCDFGQGMLVAPPMPKERFLEALRQHMNRPRPAQHAPDESAEHVA